MRLSAGDSTAHNNSIHFSYQKVLTIFVYTCTLKKKYIFFLSPIFVFCRISLSDPYSKSMPNFKCQNNLKDLKRAVERQATFYSTFYSILFADDLVLEPISQFQFLPEMPGFRRACHIYINTKKYCYKYISLQ